MSQAPPTSDPSKKAKEAIAETYETELQHLLVEYHRTLLDDLRERRKPSIMRRLGYAIIAGLGGALVGIFLQVILVAFSPANNTPGYTPFLPIGSAGVGFAYADRS